MNSLYNESSSWCEEYAKNHKLRYRAKNEYGEKYFSTKEEAQEYFNSIIEKPYTKATIMCSNDGDFIKVEVQYS